MLDNTSVRPSIPVTGVEVERCAQSGPEPLLVAAKDAAKLCGICRNTWLSLNTQGLVPRPVRLGRRVLWGRDELHNWVNAGCPSRVQWEERKRLRR